MTHNIISTGSKGNAVIYHNSIMVDCGLPFCVVKPYINNVQLILLTHEHKDHLDISTLEKISFERPGLRVGCCEWMTEKTKNLRNVDIYEIGKVYDYGLFSVSPVKLYHDVDNCGYRIFFGDHKIFHATDTAHLNGITAKGYDLYALECNYYEETVDKVSQEFFYKKDVPNTHLSEDQSIQFFHDNKGENSQLIRLHESKNN